MNDVSRAWCKGHAFVNGKCLHAKELEEHILSGKQRQKSLPDIIRDLTGHYAAIAVEQGQVCAAVDHMRSVPLYYAVSGKAFYVADDARWIENRAGLAYDLNHVGLGEYLLTGYVTGSETLIKPIRQVQAGEYVVARPEGNSWRVYPTLYYVFTHKEEGYAEEELLGKLDAAVEDSISRLLAYASGNVLALPLSAGYDSRLLAIKLVQRGRADQVVAFSYGRKGNRESARSRALAKQLGVRWEFVPYTNALWRKWYTSREFVTFAQQSDGLSAYPYITSFPAIWQLTEKGILGDDAVLIPGHTGFIAGSRIPPEYRGLSQLSQKRLVRDIFTRYYGMWPISLVKAQKWAKAERVFLCRITQRLSQLAGGSPGHMDIGKACDIYEAWEWQERSAKAICNSVRIYDYWGHKWHLPIVDKALMQVCCSVPAHLRFGKKLWKRYVERESRSALGPGGKALSGGHRGVVVSVKCLLRKTCNVCHLRSIIGTTRLRKCLQHIRKARLYLFHPLALYGVVDRDTFDRTWEEGRIPHAYWIMDRVRAFLDERGVASVKPL